MKLLVLLFALAVSPAFAAPVAFDFQGVSVVAFSQATFKSLLRRDYVISPEVLSMDRKITVSVAAVEQKNVPTFVESILAAQGILVTSKDGVFYLSAAKTAAVPAAAVSQPSASVEPSKLPASASIVAAETVGDTEVIVPKNRSAEFVSAALGAIFGSKSCVLAGSSLVITGSPADIKKMKAVANAIDLSPLSLDVSVSWVEVSRSQGAARGVSLAVNVLGAKLGVTSGSVSSGGAVSITGAKFQAVLDALDTDGRFKQVSNSRVVGDDRETLSLTVGDETPTIGSAGKDNQGNSVQNIVYRASGVIVNVTPRALANGKINLTIDGQISSFKATVTGVTGSPTLTKRQVKTGVTIGSDEVLLIGGLSDERSTDAVSGFSFLPQSWRFKNSSSANTDLVLIVSAKAMPL